MILFEDLRIRLGKMLLRHQKSSMTRQINTINLKQAKNIGIIFDARHEGHFEEVKQFIKNTLNSTVTVNVLGFIPREIKDHQYISDQKYHFFSMKECTFFMRPKQAFINQFVNSKMDLLLVLSSNYYLPLHWIVALSKAGFKAGASDCYDEELDFMIELKEKSITPLIEHLSYYLSGLNDSVDH